LIEDMEERLGRDGKVSGSQGPQSVIKAETTTI